LGGYSHPLLRRLSFVGAYEGGAIPDGKRSLTFRARIGHEDRTLTDDEIQSFNGGFRAFLTERKMELRG
jgi:phenylalanyl-tRNA synthetase beta subunit